MGPVAFKGLGRVASRAGLERFSVPRGDGYAMKIPLFVRAGRVVTVSIAPADRSIAGLTFASSLDRPVPAVRFVACEKDHPAWSYEGGVGPITFFPGGFRVTEPACVILSVRVRGRRAPYKRTVPFGKGRNGCSLDQAVAVPAR
jgi:hypothetical protein